jgi:hypothetical protein
MVLPIQISSPMPAVPTVSCHTAVIPSETQAKNVTLVPLILLSVTTVSLSVAMEFSILNWSSVIMALPIVTLYLIPVELTVVTISVEMVLLTVSNNVIMVLPTPTPAMLVVPGVRFRFVVMVSLTISMESNAMVLLAVMPTVDFFAATVVLIPVNNAMMDLAILMLILVAAEPLVPSLDVVMVPLIPMNNVIMVP